MGTYLEHPANFLNNTYVFDLEYVGTSSDMSDCYIWDISVVHLLSGKIFEISVLPNVSTIPPPFSDEFIPVTLELLRRRNAVSFEVAFNRLNAFLGPSTKLLISHNGFKSDKILLEVESRRNNIKIPYNWFFFDSLMYVRKKLPKQPSYTLRVIHTYLGLGNIDGHHFALPDAIALRNIMLKLDINGIVGPIYPAYSTSLQAVKWLGPKCEHAMITNNMRSVEQLKVSILNEFTRKILAGTPLSISEFTTLFIQERFDIKNGNAKSIASSLVDKWLDGV